MTTERAPLVSIVMPVFNAAGTIGEAMRSLVQQTYGHLEILVVDDGSADESAAIAAAFADDRIVVIRQPHAGLVSALRAGYARARGDYIARLDADDVARPDRIATQVAYLDAHPHVGLLGSHARIVWPDGREQVFEPPTADQALRRYLLWDSPFIHSSVVFRRSAYETAGGYTPGPNEDYRLWVQIARSWSLAVIPEVLVAHRIRLTSHSRSVSRRDALRARLAAQWEAARFLGPWSRALPALAATGLSLGLAAAGIDAGLGLRPSRRWPTVRSRHLHDVGPTRDDG